MSVLLVAEIHGRAALAEPELLPLLREFAEASRGEPRCTGFRALAWPGGRQHQALQGGHPCGRRLDSAALGADGAHARADAYVSLAVIASALVVSGGLPVADPIIGLGICLMILRITRQSWPTVRRHDHSH
jgi:hypothetical protein